VTLYKERTYRERVHVSDLVSFHVAIKETDLKVSADVNLEKETMDLVFECRQQLEMYIRSHPEFASSLVPLRKDPYAPPVVREMINVTSRLGVGPMASVAGAIAQYVGTGLTKLTDQVIVENGGDVFLNAHRPVTVSIFAGNSPLSERFGLLIPERNMPSGVCSSSATVGHSLSMGITDVICLVSSSTVMADGAATALGNKLKRKKDLEKIAGWAGEIEEILGGVVIVEDSMASWGDIELVELSR
jgi:ApbE superfamily uncharacterized protein (UPF0280 family)